MESSSLSLFKEPVHQQGNKVANLFRMQGPGSGKRRGLPFVCTAQRRSQDSPLEASVVRSTLALGFWLEHSHSSTMNIELPYKIVYNRFWKIVNHSSLSDKHTRD